MIKLQNVKNPKVIIEVEKKISGLYLGTKEWRIYEENKPKFEEFRNEK